MTRAEKTNRWLAAGWPLASAELLASFNQEEAAGFDFRVQTWIEEADRADATTRTAELLAESVGVDLDFAEEGHAEHVEDFRGETWAMSDDDHAERKKLLNDRYKLRRYAGKAGV